MFVTRMSPCGVTATLLSFAKFTVKLIGKPHAMRDGPEKEAMWPSSIMLPETVTYTKMPARVTIATCPPSTGEELHQITAKWPPGGASLGALSVNGTRLSAFGPSSTDCGRSSHDAMLEGSVVNRFWPSEPWLNF